MKTLKISLIAAIVTALIIAVCGVATASAERGFYALEGLVIGWERIHETDDRLVAVMGEDGNVWGLYDEELKIGDVIVMRMFDLSDEANQDDEVTDFMLIESLDTNGIMEWWESKGLN